MGFCKNCGKQLAEDGKFCTDCGTAVSINDFNQRKIQYEGEIHKCPNCGEVIGSFVSICTSCGYELRGTRSSDTIRTFSFKFEQAVSEEHKVVLVRNFPISNTKEDIFEFMILASTNIIGEYNKAVFNAWQAKFEQCYQKAKLSFCEDRDFAKIQNIYDQTNKQISKERAAHSVNKVGNAVSKFTATFPNPVFGIVAVLLGFYEIGRIVKGDFAGFDIIMVAIILWCTYKITNKSEK